MTEVSILSGVWVAGYPDVAIELDHSVPGALTYTLLGGESAGFTATEEVTTRSIADGVFLTSFQDAYATVVSVLDLTGGKVTTLMVLRSDNSLVWQEGPLTPRT